MSNASEPQAGAPPVTNPAGGSGMTGGGPLQWEPPSVEDAARLFPNYEILALIGRGGMGAVYKARQTSLDRLVAIKLLPLEVSANKDFADRFVREARTMAKLSHPNIIAVHDFGTTSAGHLFFVMEFVNGAMLHSIIHEVGLDADQALYLAGEVCVALAYAHENGVVHRDIKPANVMVDGKSRVKVADFGLARLTDANPEMHGMTMTGMVMGTPDYMAPEQKRGMNVDARADIYSVGVMLYEMVCREVPQGAFDLPSRRTGCDPRVDTIVLKAMKSSAVDRYQSAKEMEAALEAARKPMANALIPQPRLVMPRALAVAPRAGVPVAVPRAAAPGPRYAAPTAITAQVVKSRTPRYGGIAATVVVAIVVIVMVLPKSKPKLAEERTPPESNAPNRQPSATKPTPAPVAETPKEKPAINAPEAKPAPPTPEPPVAATPEMKPKPEPSPAPPPADAPQQNATAKWLTEQEPQWKAAFALEVTAAFDKAVADQRKQYLSSLDAQLASATRTGSLLEAVACRDELQRMNTGGAPGDDDATTPASLKAMRAGYRKNLAALETDRTAKARAVHARYDSILAQNLTLLTQNQRLEEALLLKTKREELAAAWLKPSTLPEAPKPQPAPPTPGAKFGTAQIATATRERPFENSIGMRFVPVPISGGPSGGQRVLFSVWETRVQDFEQCAKAKGWQWPQPEFPQGPTHPAVGMSWESARIFCEWLTEHERKAGRLGATERYRLPTDHEWSCGVGIGDQEEPSKTPQQKSRKIAGVYPWGSAWPPPAGGGNYSGEEATGSKVEANQRFVQGWRDAFPYSAPVGSFAPNRFGICDLGGNVWEWCEDHPNPAARSHVLRGGCFRDGEPDLVLSSVRWDPVSERRNWWGFRVVLSAGGPAQSAGNTQPAAGTQSSTSEQVAAQLKGTWLFHWNQTGFEATYIFNADGTTGKDGTGGVTWRLAGDKVLVEGRQGKIDKTIFLPIDPKGTKVRDSRKNYAITATKL